MNASNIARRKAIRAAQDAVIRNWWPKASAREIGMMIDLGAEIVVTRAKAMGFKSRSYSSRPE